MRWMLNGMTPGGVPISQYVDPSRLLDMSLGTIAGDPPQRRARSVAETAYHGIERNKPDEDGWLLVVPDDDEGTRIAEELAPLVEHRLRRRDPTSDAPERRPEEAIKRFPASALRQPELGVWDQHNLQFARDLPFYVLIAGPPSKIPFELEHLVARREQCAGRIAFATFADYRAYAEKVVAWEPDDDVDRTPRKGLPFAAFATDHWPHDATRRSRERLVEPLIENIRRDKTRPILPRLRGDATRDALLELLRGPGPRLMMSATHGLAVPGTGDDAQARRIREQGAILCQDAPYDDEEVLLGSAVRDGPVLAGGIWLMFACFGAGTPRASNFYRALEDRSLLGFHEGGPFVADLPARLLANPDGPLAVIGHLDPGFVHSFSDPQGVGGERFEGIKAVTRLLLNGARAGVSISALAGAAGSFAERHRQIEVEVAQLIGKAPGGASTREVAAALEEAESGSRLAQIREHVVDAVVSYYDFRNFVVLGDPAAKLPRVGAQPASAKRPPASTQTTRVPAADTAGTAAPPSPVVPPVIAEAKQQGRLVITCSELLFSAEGVALPPGGGAVVLLVPEPCADVRDRPGEEEAPDGGKQRYFEAAEHQACDERAELRFSATEVYRTSELRLAIPNGLRLRYGEIISLFADLYAEPGVHVRDGEAAFRASLAVLEDEPKARMRRVLDVMNDERLAVDTALSEAGSVAAVYGELSRDLNKRYNEVTGGGSFITELFPEGRYLKLAAANYDHFGDDAVTSYRVAHQVACDEARAAREKQTPGERRAGLTRAYVMNACADHFLTDLFASGHLRVPRRALAEHFSWSTTGNLLAKLMHDEDNRYGVRVRNRRGDRWVAYGDAMFHDQRHEVGRDLAREAVKASAAEVWTAFDTGAAPAFAALEIAPDVERARDDVINHAPLFVVHEGELMVRERETDRACWEYKKGLTATGVRTLLDYGAQFLFGKHGHGG